MTSGKLADGTPFIAIGNDEPEAKKLIVHTMCSKCGKQYYFDLWAMINGEVITCEHCGHMIKREVNA